MSSPDPGSTRAAEAALARVAPQWLARRGVISVEVARRWQDGASTDEVGIRVTVARILPADEVPEGELFPDALDGFAVDIVEGRPPELEGET